MTLLEYRRKLGWSLSELARRAGLDFNTTKRAENGEPVSSRTAMALARAISEGLNQTILPGDIDGLNVNI